MGKLIYSAIMSLDGYIEDETGNFDWAEPDEEVFAFVNDLERTSGIHLYGRRMYEVMAVWETEPALAEHSPLMADFAQIWQAVDKVVYSSTMTGVVTARTRLEREFDPEAVRRLKATAGSDIQIAGPNLATSAFRAGLVDECHLFVVPWIIGGGKKGLPEGVRARLQLLDQRAFAGGVIYIRYGVSPAADGAEVRANEGGSQ